MDNRVRATVAKVHRLRLEARERRAEVRVHYYRVLRELAELARKSVQRRREGDRDQ